ncbi:LysM peptidoglycan-binding domain-containing protein [Trinickia fusca]|uniref:LysM peptidoglycan-binding domain-containing protein n=2 Tax=Trinickia fusca TaxID=2419777 RepID=A0A494XAX8_9BURK|nr:LysM peptidoglycan-binding domain-containing protein [Trinickia fusca]
MRVPVALGLTGAMLMAGCTLPPWQGGPGSAPAATATQRGGVGAGYYRVNPGDTLASVAAGFGQRPQDIAEWNRLPSTASLLPGQVLRVVPPGATGSVSPHAANRFAWPAYGDVQSVALAGEGRGIVIAGRADESIKAASDGVVIYVGNAIDRYRSLIVIKHTDTLVTAYAHNGTAFVKEGDTVKKGQVIAQMGADANGRSTVEFEIRRAGTPVDPLAYLPRSGG